MKKIALAFAFALTFIIGVNSGYSLGADTMQCVVIAMVAPDKEDAVDDACKAAGDWSTYGPTYMARWVWIEITGQSVPDHFIKTH